MADEVHFCDATGPLACFSNYYAVPITIDGKVWPSTEHFFQAQKFTSPEFQEEVRQAATPADSKKLGYSKRPDFRKDWEAVKEGLMKKALHAKFAQHADLKKILLDTGSKKIVERNDDDAYWGDGKDRAGKNRLGVILMELRAEFVAAK